MKPILCPRCRQLIGSEENSCSRCGASRPSRWNPASWRRGKLDGDWAVRTLITVNVLFYLLSVTIGGGGSLSPKQSSLLLLGATGTVPVERFGAWWTLLAANYLHGGILHIFFNMMALHQIGPWVIREYGLPRMITIYTLGGICGFYVSCLAGIPFTIGASAALCALIGALLYYGRSRGGFYGNAVYREMSGWVMGLVLFGLVFPGINNWGHAGGIFGGIILGLILGYEERRRESLLDRVLGATCATGTVAVLAWAAFRGVSTFFGS